MPENTELSELQCRLHDAHESASRLRDTITRLEAENVLLAKLAAETPQFFNPWHAAEAVKLRDAILANTERSGVQSAPASGWRRGSAANFIRTASKSRRGS